MFICFLLLILHLLDLYKHTYITHAQNCRTLGVEKVVPWYAISYTVRGDVLFTIFLRSHCLDVLKALSFLYVVVLSNVTKNVM